MCWKRLVRYLRSVAVSSWVDDLSQRVQGARRHVFSKTVLAASSRAKGSRILVKCAIPSSDKALPGDVKSRLQKRGIHLKVDMVARDLGLDATIAKTRRLQTSNAWFTKGRAWAEVIKSH